MAKVYRIEHKDIKYNDLVMVGPYGAGGHFDSSQWTNRYHSKWTGHPAPWSDGIEVPNSEDESDYFCGFPTLKKLMEWFNAQERTNLKQLGFVVAVYDAAKVRSGGHQVVFIPKSVRIETRDVIQVRKKYVPKLPKKTKASKT
jgi:hypothetical protein